MPATRLPTAICFCDRVTLTFDLILIGGRGLVMDYPCGTSNNIVTLKTGLKVSQGH